MQYYAVDGYLGEELYDDLENVVVVLRQFLPEDTVNLQQPSVLLQIWRTKTIIIPHIIDMMNKEIWLV